MKKYEMPELNLVYFDDVITTSGGIEDDGSADLPFTPS